MGLGKRDNGIVTFTPDNTENELYIETFSGQDFEKVLELIKSHFGENVLLTDLSIHAEHIQTDCLYHDCYDSSDYTNYIVITRK